MELSCFISQTVYKTEAINGNFHSKIGIIKSIDEESYTTIKGGADVTSVSPSSERSQSHVDFVGVTLTRRLSSAFESLPPVIQSLK